MLKKILSACMVLVLFGGCVKNTTTGYVCDTNYNACSFQAPAAEVQAVQNYLTANSITATQHCSGLFYTIDQPGTGAKPTVCSNITVTYEGRLTDGTVFDSTSVARPLSLDQVILGWKNAIPLISAGG